jgi:undecaprenyl diphosphate synthase
MVRDRLDPDLPISDGRAALEAPGWRMSALDLILRTGAEMRLGGSLPWQSSPSKFSFTAVHWPAFRELDSLRAVRSFQQRERRMGR